MSWLKQQLTFQLQKGIVIGLGFLVCLYMKPGDITLSLKSKKMVAYGAKLQPSL